MSYKEWKVKEWMKELECEVIKEVKEWNIEKIISEVEDKENYND